MSGLNDIDKLKNFMNKVEILANGENSKDNNGIIDNPKEMSIFDYELKNAKPEERIILLMALDMPKQKQESKPEVEVKLTEEYSKSERKGSRTYILSRIDSLSSKYNIGKIDYDGLISDVSNLKNKSKYDTVLLKSIQDVSELLKTKTLDSKKAIEEVHDSLKDAIEEQGGEKEFVKFKKEVLKKFIQMESTRQKNKEYEEMASRFTALRNDGKSREEAYKTIKQEFGNKGSYYKDILSTGPLGMRNTEFKKKTVRNDARQQVNEALREQMTDADGAQTKGEVKDKVKEDLGNDYDKYAKRYTNGRDRSTKDKINFEDSDFKSNAKTVASKNRVEKAKRDGFTRKELEEAFSHEFLGIGTKHTSAINMLINQGFIEVSKDENGNEIYKPTQKLMDKIELCTGYHNTLDKQEKDDNALSEVKRLRNAILADMEGNDKVKFTDKDVIALAKLCGFDYKGKNFVKDMWQVGPGALANVGAGLGSTILTGVDKLAATVTDTHNAVIDASSLKPYIFSGEIPISIDLVNNIELNLTFPNDTSVETMKNIANQFGVEWSSVTVNGTTLTVTQEQLKHYNELYEVIGLELNIKPEDIGVEAKLEGDVSAKSNAEKNIKKAVAFTVAYTMAMLALQAAMKDSGEIPITATQFDNNKTYDQYIRELNQEEKLTDAQKNALGSLANLYVIKDENGQPLKDENGNIKWNSEGYKQLLNKIAGDGSVLNKKELQTWADLQLKKFKPEDVKTEDQKKVEELETENKELQKALDDCEKQPKAELTPEADGEKWTEDYSGEVGIIEHSARYGWENLGRMWECCDELTPKEARRVIQVIQAIDPNAVQGVYNIDRILDIARDAFGEDCSRPHVAGREQELKEKYPELDIDRLRAAYKANVSADKDGKITAPIELVDNAGNVYKRRAPERDTTDYGPGSNKITAKYSKSEQKYGGTEYWIKKSGQKPRKVNKKEYENSPYKISQNA